MAGARVARLVCKMEHATDGSRVAGLADASDPLARAHALGVVDGGGMREVGVPVVGLWCRGHRSPPSSHRGPDPTRAPGPFRRGPRSPGCRSRRTRPVPDGHGRRCAARRSAAPVRRMRAAPNREGAVVQPEALGRVSGMPQSLDAEPVAAPWSRPTRGAHAIPAQAVTPVGELLCGRVHLRATRPARTASTLTPTAARVRKR